jgi:protein-arginine kinase activator protein McsA
VESVPHTPKPSIEELQKKMEKAVAEENYELAASLRDEIRTLRVKSEE